MRARRTAAGFAAAALVAALPVAMTSPAAAKAGTGCQQGYSDPGAVTLEEGLALPRIEAGLSTEPAPYTVEQLTALFDEIDGNHDGRICLKAVSNLRGSSGKHHAFFYLADDNAHPQG